MKIQLREALERYNARTGVRLTYEQLAQTTGLSRATIESIAARPEYQPSLDAVERLCIALGCEPGELLKVESGRE